MDLLFIVYINFHPCTDILFTIFYFNDLKLCKPVLPTSDGDGMHQEQRLINKLYEVIRLVYLTVIEIHK